MSNIATLRTRRDKIVADAQKYAQKNTYTSEERSRIEAMLADVQSIENTIAILESAESCSTGRPNREQPGAASGQNPEERAAFAHYLKTGERNKDLLREQRDLNTGNASVVVAQDFLPQLIAAKKAWGQLTVR